MKLLAAIVYGEASVNSPYEEKAAIASAIIRYRNANNFKSVNQLIAKRKFYSSAVLNNVVRYQLVMCSDAESEYPDLYKASMNALDPNGIDYANGGCFWDGVDLKTKGRDQPHYQLGYIFTDPAHDIFSIGDSEPAHRFGEFGNYDYTYESTAGYGKTVFWKLTKGFLNAKRGKQCH